MKTILISGKKRSGKDYSAALIKRKLEELGRTVKIESFAHPIKSIISKMLGLTSETLEKFKNDADTFKLVVLENDKRCCDTQELDFRKILQMFGTECMKPLFGDTVWVDLLKNKILKLEGVDYVLVSDFRFEEEVISHHTIKVINNHLETSDNHASETGLDNFKFKYYIDNTGYRSIEDDVDAIIKQLESD